MLGEGIEKKTNDLAKEVEAQTKALEEAAAKKAAAAPDSAAAPAPEAAAAPEQAVRLHSSSPSRPESAAVAGLEALPNWRSAALIAVLQQAS